MNLAEVLIAVAAMIALGLGLAAVLAVADKGLYVFINPRISQVEEMLPGSNCGACGQPGCQAFAEEVVAGNASPGECTPSSEENTEAIAELLGVEVGGEEKQVARLACAGGTNVARQRARYEGLQTCRAAALVAGGGKGCAWGCLGLEDCMRVCTFDSIVMDAALLPVVDEDLCTACGDCVDVCPKGLFSLQPVSHQLWVACKNEAFDQEAEAECEVACTACGLCAQDAPEGVVRMLDNLAVVDYARDHQTAKAAIQRCPTGAIVWLSSRQGALKGIKAKRIVRQTALPIG